MKLTFITVQEAAELAGVTKITISNLCKARTIRHRRKHLILYPCKEDVLLYKDKIEQVYEITCDIEQMKLKYLADRYEIECAIQEQRDKMHKEICDTGMFPLRVKAIHDTAMAIVQSLNDDTFKPTELDIMMRMLQSVNGAEGVGDDLHLTKERVRQRWCKALRKLSVYKHQWLELDKYKERIAELEKQLADFDACKLRVAELERQLGITDLKAYEAIEKSEENIKLFKLLDTKIIDIGDFSVRTYNCLLSLRAKTLSDVVSFKEKDLLNCRNFGKKSMEELKTYVESHGLSFGMDLTEYNLYKKFDTTSD